MRARSSVRVQDCASDVGARSHHRSSTVMRVRLLQNWLARISNALPPRAPRSTSSLFREFLDLSRAAANPHMRSVKRTEMPRRLLVTRLRMKGVPLFEKGRKGLFPRDFVATDNVCVLRLSRHYIYLEIFIPDSSVADFSLALSYGQREWAYTSALLASSSNEPLSFGTVFLVLVFSEVSLKMCISSLTL